MKPAVKMARREPAAEPELQLKGFLAKFDDKIQANIPPIRKAVQRRLRGANELVYDNYNFFVIGYSPTERPSDSIVSLAADRHGVRLCFPYCGARLRDPNKILEGSGSKNRFVRLESAKALARPEVEELIAQAVSLCKPLSGEKGKLIIRSVSAKQRPRK